MPLTLVLFAFHDLGVKCLAWLLTQPQYRVALVVTHKPYKDENVWFGSVEECARQNSVPVIMHDQVSADEIRAAVAVADPDMIFALNYRKLIPEFTYRLAKRGAYNIHDSLLPDYKGFAPSVWVLIDGQRETGVTLHELAPEVDAGAIIGQRRVSISDDDDIAALLTRLIDESVILFQTMLPRLVDGTAVPIRQNPAEGFFRPRRSLKDDYIDWRWPFPQLRNFLRAVAPPISFVRSRHTSGDIRIDSIGHSDMTPLPLAPVIGQVLRVNGNVLHVQAGDGIVIVQWSPISSTHVTLVPGDILS